MKKPVTCVFTILAFACLVYGQKNEKPKISVIWSPDADCHVNNSPEVKIRNPQCSTVQLDELTFYIVHFGGVSYAMTHRPARDFIVASVQISNRSFEAIQVNPLRSRVARFRSKEQFTANSKGDITPALSQDQLRQATVHESTVIAESEGGIRAGLQVQERYEDTLNRSRTRVISRTTINEPAPPPSSNPTPTAITNNILIPRAIFDKVMKSRIVPIGEKAAGHIVFKDSENKDDYVVFYMNAGAIEFVFPTVKPST